MRQDIVETADANQALRVEIAECRRVERLTTALFKIVQLGTVDVSQAEFCHQVHGVTGGLINADNFRIELLSEDRCSMEFPYCYFNAGVQSWPSRPLRRGLSEYVIRHGKPFNGVTQDIRELESLGEIEAQSEHPPPACWIGVPLFGDDEVIGLIVAESQDDAVSSGPADQQFLSLMATQVANVLHRIRSMEKLQRSLHDRNVELELAFANLKQAQEHAVVTEKLASIGQLAAGVAHEINNPIGYVNSNLGTLQTYVTRLLAAIETYAAALARTGGSAAVAEAVDIGRRFEIDFLAGDAPQLIVESREGIGRVCKIVRDLKDFARRDRDEEWENVDVHLGLESTLNIVANELKYKAQIVKTFAELPPIECLPSELNQVFMNVLMNAGQAIAANGLVTVSTGRSGDNVWIAIGDDGDGIPADVLPRIFDPFFTTKAVGAGTGLGLSISHGIVAKHHGRIEITSVPAQGTLVRIELPIEQPKQ